MKKNPIAACVACLFAQSAVAQEFGVKYPLVKGFGIAPVPNEKSASASTLGARATANLNATVFGGFEVAANTRVYILVRGTSLRYLDVTDWYLETARLRIFNAAGQDIFAQGGYPGFFRLLEHRAH